MPRQAKLPKVLSEQEQRTLLWGLNRRYPSSHRNICILRLMLEAGLRAGEVVALRPEHLDMRTCKLIVREGKGAKDRVLWISDDLRDVIGAWLERRPESEWLFPTRDGDQVQTRYLRALVKRLARKADVAEAASAHVRHGPAAGDQEPQARAEGARACLDRNDADLHAHR